MTTFTPGPWYATMNKHYWEVTPMNAGEDGIPFTVADVCSSEPGNRDGGRQEANARIIAAAPELLEALKALLDDAKRMNGSPLPVWAYSWDKAHAAIAKAEAQP